jgi:hypothetical protein
MGKNGQLNTNEIKENYKILQLERILNHTERNLENKLKELDDLKNSLQAPTLVQKIEIKDIKLVSNIRKSIDLSGLESMEDDNIGQLQPLLLTSDNYLIDGYRRLEKLKRNKKTTANIYNIIQDYNSIKDKLKELQYFSNESRKNLDNFDISDFFYSYVEENFTQEYIAKKFNKSVSLISQYLRLQDLNKDLKDLVKQFQSYCYSYEKFNQLNLQNKLTNDEFYQKNLNEIISIKSLYQVSKQRFENTQKIEFVRIFKDRLLDSEIENLIGKQEIQEKDQNKIISKSFKIFFDKLPKESSDPKVNKIIKKAQELQDLISQVSLV